MKAIEDYVERFFEGNGTDKTWACVAEIRAHFGLDTAEAYHYVAKHLSKKWEVN